MIETQRYDLTERLSCKAARWETLKTFLKTALLPLGTKAQKDKTHFPDYEMLYQEAATAAAREASVRYVHAITKSRLVDDFTLEQIVDLLRTRLSRDLEGRFAGMFYDWFLEMIKADHPPRPAVFNQRLKDLGNSKKWNHWNGTLSWNLSEAFKDELRSGKAREELRRWDEHRRLIQEQRDKIGQAVKVWQSDQASGGDAQSDGTKQKAHKKLEANSPLTPAEVMLLTGLRKSAVYDHPLLERVPTGTAKVLFTAQSVRDVLESPPE